MLNHRSFFIFVIVSSNYFIIHSMQLGLSKTALVKNIHHQISHRFKSQTKDANRHSDTAKQIRSIIEPLKTEKEKWAFYNLITNKQSATVWKTIKINKKTKLPIYCTPYPSLDDHLSLIFLLKAVNKTNVAAAYQKFFQALSADIEQHLHVYELLNDDDQPKTIVYDLCTRTATEKIVRALQAELEPELKIINVTLEN